MVNTNLISRVGEIFTPLLKESIIETGRITPEEFVIAGDHLISKCPSWAWQSISPTDNKQISWPLGQKKNGVSYLPPNKQYLVTRRVLCLSRAISRSGLKEEDDEFEFSAIVTDSPIIDTDPDRYMPESSIKPCRKYDITITYDKFYQVPRVWLFGYDENDAPLTQSQVYEDISTEHAKKTVTLESHPFLPLTMASIHPCKHASVMSSMIKMLKSSNNKRDVPFPSEQYLRRSIIF